MALITTDTNNPRAPIEEAMKMLGIDTEPKPLHERLEKILKDGFRRIDSRVEAVINAYYPDPDRQAYMIGNDLFVPPAMMAELNRRAEQMPDGDPFKTFMGATRVFQL